MTKSTLHISAFPVKTPCVSKIWLVSSMETWYNNRETNSDGKSCRIIMTTATLVGEKIRARDYSK